jgi:hypothetical protein
VKCGANVEGKAYMTAMLQEVSYTWIFV